MEGCANLEKCAWVKEFRSQKSGFVDHYIKHYCEGDWQDKCKRKQVSKELGGPQNVPLNMQPNGRPMPGTDDSGWSDAVKKIVQ